MKGIRRSICNSVKDCPIFGGLPFVALGLAVCPPSLPITVRLFPDRPQAKGLRVGPKSARRPDLGAGLKTRDERPQGSGGRPCLPDWQTQACPNYFFDVPGALFVLSTRTKSPARFPPVLYFVKVPFGRLSPCAKSLACLSGLSVVTYGPWVLR